MPGKSLLAGLLLALLVAGEAAAASPASAAPPARSAEPAAALASAPRERRWSPAEGVVPLAALVVLGLIVAHMAQPPRGGGRG
jgi:hypothetical protein